jgi:hypothetical protein
MINLLVAVVLDGLVVFTITYMLIALNGPWDIFKRIRELAGIQHDVDGYPNVISNKFFSKLLICFWCTSTWISAPISIITVLIIGSAWYTWFYLWLASIAIAGLWYKIAR